MQKSATINGKVHTFATITVDQAEKAQLASKTGLEFNKALVLLSLQAGGDTTITASEIGALGYFNGADNSFSAFAAPALEVNGLKAAQTKGEEPVEAQ